MSFTDQDRARLDEFERRSDLNQWERGELRGLAIRANGRDKDRAERLSRRYTTPAAGQPAPADVRQQPPQQPGLLSTGQPATDTQYSEFLRRARDDSTCPLCGSKRS